MITYATRPFCVTETLVHVFKAIIALVVFCSDLMLICLHYILYQINLGNLISFLLVPDYKHQPDTPDVSQLQNKNTKFGSYVGFFRVVT